MRMTEEDDSTDAAFASMSFEEALKELEGIVRRLESGDVPLDESIALYARGEKLRSQCTRRLADAEARIQQLTTDGNGAVTGARSFGSD
jgi:exodeoxyribonuclease VII small subunit